MLEELVIENITPEEIDLDSFEIKPKLNPKIWKNENKVNLDVKKQLLKIADDFFNSLDVPWVSVKDVQLTGSLAGYSWSKFSDIDLHVIIKYKEINKDTDLVTEYIKSKKDNWTKEHPDLKINGFNIEVSGQDEKEDIVSSGIYSLEDDEWIRKPKKQEPKFDKDAVKEKAAGIVNQIDDIEKLFNDKKYDQVLKDYEPLWKEIKSMRKRGLGKSGEFSIENIVFKVLRRGEYLEKLTDFKNRAYDLNNSIK